MIESMKRWEALMTPAKQQFITKRIAEHDTMLKEHDALLKEMWNILSNLTSSEPDTRAAKETFGDEIVSSSPIIIQEEIECK